MGEPWFRVEQSGWAAHPINWKGWAMIAAYMVVLIAWAVIVFVIMEPTGANIAGFLLVSLVVTGVLTVIAMKKTEGTWAWQRRAPPDTE
jgi:tryptophan-rich sensory protein